MALNNVGSGSYAQYNDFDSLSYICTTYLMEHDEMIWKLLYYNTPDAWNKTDLTPAEKASLIYKGEDDTSRFSVFFDTGQPDVITAQKSEIRISPYNIFPDNRTVGSVSMYFEVYSNYHINHLSNYKTRVDMIAQRFIQVFNGATLKNTTTSLGKLHLDNFGTYGTRLESGGQLPFRGKWLLMGLKSS